MRKLHLTAVLAWRMMWRDLRAGELHLLGLAIAIAVASLCCVGFLADRVERGLEREANQLLGGDLLLRADRPWPSAFADEAHRRGLQLTTTILFTSMASTAEGAALAGVKVVEDAYPLRGALRITTASGQADRLASRGPEPGEVWLDERLSAELGVRIGDRVGFGQLEFRMGAQIRYESERGANFFSLLPRAMFNMVDLPATGLLVEGSRATWRLHVAGAPDAVADYERWARARLGRGQGLETIANARPEVRAALDQAQRFLRLAALLAVILAAVAVGLCARRFMQRHLDACAVMRCLGAGQARVLGIVLGEFLLFGLLATLAGAAIGAGVQWGLAEGVRTLIGTALPAPSLQPLLQGLAVGFVLLLGFVLPQLLRLRRVSTLRVLRRDLELAEPWSATAWGLGLAALGALIFWIAADVGLGLRVAGGFALALSVFALAAWAGLRLAVRCKGQGSLRGGGWRYGLAALGRRSAASVLQVSALGLGMTALLLLTLIRADLLETWQRRTPVDAPNHFLINIQPEQRAALAALFAAEALAVPEIQPMIRGRLLAINGQTVDPQAYGDARTRRLAEREFNLSHSQVLPAGNQVVDGQWHGVAREPQFSVEKGIAASFGLKPGDQVRFEVGGRSIEAPIGSVRSLDWGSMQVNFFFIASPGLLEDAPASLITSFRLPPARKDFVPRLVAAFPNLTVIDVSAVLAQMQDITVRLTGVVQFVFGFALLAGVLVLLAALQATHDERAHELAILRTLGARKRQIRQSLLAEFLVLGGLAGALAGVAASALSWALARQVFNIDYTPGLLPLLLATLLGTSLVVCGGWLGTRRLLSRPPLISLRALA